MRFHIVTLFPNAFDSYLGESILKRAIEDKKISFKFYNPRDFSKEKNSKGKAVRIDKRPYGGGPGMVLEALPVVKAIEKALKNAGYRPPLKSSKSSLLNPPNLGGGKRGGRAGGGTVKIIFLSPSGTQFDTAYAKSAAKKYTDIIIVSGRYEGIDARVKKIFKCEDVSVGPFVLTGGELPAMIIADCVSRQVPGVLGDYNSLEEMRVSSSDVYTRPEVFTYKGKIYRVPKILLSGHRAKIDEWKKNS